MGRQFFVGGNFKMNGSVEGIKGIVKHLNDAKVDEKVGTTTSLYIDAVGKDV